MVNQMRIGGGVVGVLLVLFLTILYARFVDGGRSPEMHIETVPPVASPEDRQPRVIRHPTIVTGDDRPLDAFPSIPPLPDPYRSGPNPGALIPDASAPAPQFEARRQQDGGSRADR